MAEVKFNAVVEAQEGLTMKGKSRDFELIIDEPSDLGGNNKGMNPVECLLNAIGGCKAIVARSFAPAFEIDLKNIKIEVIGTLDPDGFMGLNDKAKIGFSHLETNYYFDSDADDDKLKEFIDFVDGNCPVMDTIINTPTKESILNRF